MAPSASAQRRTHSLLLLQRLLNLRDGASPFTLLIDTLEQSAQPVEEEFMARAKLSKRKIVFVSFQTLRKPKQADVFIVARRKQVTVLSQEISSHLPKPQVASSQEMMKALLIFDTLLPLAATVPSHLPSFLSSLLSPSTCVLATYHADIPIPVLSANSQDPSYPYSPGPLATLEYLVTAILRISNLSHAIVKKRARDRSLQEPVFGLDEGKEGVLMGIRGGGAEGTDGVVVEMEIRRKSGRGVKDVFVLSTSVARHATLEGILRGEPGEKLCLLDDHPLYASLATTETGIKDNEMEGTRDGEVEMTFSMGLTDKQRRDRDGVVLPYFDAQKGEGSGDGGKILYEMDRVDDFDEEEDEI